MKPPYHITGKILSLISSISQRVGEINAVHLNKPPTQLRRKNRIKTIQASLEIEGNTLSVEQITELFENKRVVAPQKDILEVKNAIAVYDKLDDLEANSLDSLCYAHMVLMKGLISKPGKLRTTSVGIMRGDDLAHMAPSGERVPYLMKDLFAYLKSDDDLLLIKSCVFHYEFEFIHPFEDGNGRMGRLWQTLILKEYARVFEYLPIETLVKERQQEYYGVLSKSDQQGNSTPFIGFMLEILDEALKQLLKHQPASLSGSDRITHFRDLWKELCFSRQDYMQSFKNISTATASRDLKLAVEEGILEKTGDKRTARYRFV